VSTLNHLIGEDTDSSDFTSEDRSVKIVESSKSTSAYGVSSSEADGANEIYGLKSRNNELMVNLMKQRGWIDELENEVEVLVDSLKQKEEVMERVLESNAVNENRLRQMAVVKADKWKLTVEIDNLKQVIQEQADSLKKMSLQEQLLHDRGSSVHLINRPKIGASDSYANTLQQKIDELSRIVLERDNEIKDLTEVLQIKELGLMEFGRTVDETHRRQTHVEDKLEATSREADNLRYMTNILQDTVDNRNNELQEMKLKLEAEKEVTMILEAEKKMVTKKYEELAQVKDSNDKTFMDLYDEVIPGGKVEVPEGDSEDDCSERQVEYSHEEQIEGYCYLGFEQSIQARSRKSKPTRAPPPVPSQPVKIHNTIEIKANSGFMAEKENDEAERMDQAAYEYFLMCSIAVRMNLAEVYQKDEIMAVDSGKLWQVCQMSNIPMNKYYFYIENALREEFGLPTLSYQESRSSERPINANCCIVM